MRLRDKVALITGANSGIGQAIAKRFAEEGAHVVINYRPKDAARDEEVRAQAAGYPTRSIAVAADVTERDQVESMFKRVLDTFGRVDIAVNNAGIEIKRPFLEVPDEEWHRVMDVNLYGAFVVSQVAARAMVERGGGGRIVNISSTHEDISFPGYTSYCCSKGGMRMLARNLCIELAPYKITVNNIAPGAITTPINSDVLEDKEERAAAIREIPLERFGTPEEVAGCAVYLASDEAAYVTGSTFYIDGGLTQQVTAY